LAIERHDNDVLVATIEVCMKEIHPSPPAISVIHTALGNHDSNFGDSPLLYEECQEVVLIVERPRMHLMAIIPGINQTETEFRNLPALLVPRMAIDSHTE